MIPEWLPSAALGLVLGVAVSVLNHFILQQGVRKAAAVAGSKGTSIIMLRYGIRYLLNILALFIVYKNIPMLIATAIGLTANKNYIFVKYLTSGKFAKKGVN